MRSVGRAMAETPNSILVHRKGRRNMSNRKSSALIIYTITVLLILSIGAGNALAGDVTLAWDAIDEDILEGYIIYYGTSSGSYDTSIDV